MKKIIVASQNPVKLNATHLGFQKMFPDEVFVVEGVSVSSNVSEQPMSDEETLNGAMQRVKNARLQITDADYWVGIEGGVHERGLEMEEFGWVVIVSADGLCGKGKTGSFFLPPAVADLIRQGKELGEADDLVFNRSNSKQANGAVGILTGDLIHRTSFCVDAIVLALIPFRNREYYPIV